MKNIYLIFVVVFFGSFLFGEELYPNEKPLIMKNCTTCHDIMYLSARSEKAWELTVYRMREMIAKGEESFTDNEAERMIKYLSNNLPEYSQINVFKFFNEETVESGEIEPVNEIESGEFQNVDESKNPPVLVTYETPVVMKFSTKMVRVAKFCGFSSVSALVFLLISGLSRRKLKLNFVVIHRLAGTVLLISLSVHAVIYIMKYGNPPVLWYWLGIVGVMFTFMAQISAVLKKRIGSRFIRIHAIFGILTLVFGLLHWLIAYL